MNIGKFTLTYGTLREKILEIQESLNGFKLKNHEIMNGLLILEEVFMLFRRGYRLFY